MVSRPETPAFKDQSPRTDGEAMVGTVYAAYIEGRRRPKDSSLEAGRLELLSAMSARLKSRLSAGDLLLISRCKRCCDASRSIADHANIDGARLLLNAARVFAGADELSDEARILCRSEIIPAHAYVEFRCRNFLQSRRLVRESLVVDQQLEEQYGYSGSHAHRLHLLTRMVALESRISGVKSGLQLSVQVFRYLTGKSESVPVPGNWGRKYKTAITPHLLRFFAVQLVGEIAAITTDPTKKRLASEALDGMDPEIFDCDDDFWRTQVLAWLRLKALSSSDVGPYLTCCATYLAQNSPKMPILWYTAALDAALACASFASEESIRLRQEVVSDLARSRYLRPELQQAVSVLRKGLRRALATGCLPN